MTDTTTSTAVDHTWSALDIDLVTAALSCYAVCTQQSDIARRAMTLSNIINNGFETVTKDIVS